MPVTEAARHHLLTALEGALGKEATMTLADHLPPVGWADVATKQDLASLEQRIDERFVSVEERIDHRFAVVESRFETMLHREITTLHRHLFFAIITACTAMAAVVAATIEAALP